MSLSRLGTIGPRTRRRLVRAGIAVAVLAGAVVAVALTTRSTHHATTGTTQRPGFSKQFGPQSDTRYAANSERLTFGMTRRQVRNVVGPPAKMIGSCWQYRLDETISFHGKRTIDAERLCFSYGVYNTHYTQWQGVWRDDNGAVAPDATH